MYQVRSVKEKDTIWLPMLFNSSGSHPPGPFTVNNKILWFHHSIDEIVRPSTYASYSYPPTLACPLTDTFRLSPCFVLTYTAYTVSNWVKYGKENSLQKKLLFTTCAKSISVWLTKSSNWGMSSCEDLGRKSLIHQHLQSFCLSVIFLFLFSTAMSESWSQS